MHVHQLLYLNALDGSGLLHFPLRLVSGVLLAGGCVADLQLQGRLQVRDGTLTVLDPTPTGSIPLDAVLDVVATQPKAASVATAAHHIVGATPITQQCADAMASDGLARVQTKRLLWFFTKSVVHPVDTPEVRAGLSLLERALAGEDLTNAETTALVLARPAELLPFMAADLDLAEAEAFVDRLDRPDLRGVVELLATGYRNTKRSLSLQP